MSLQLLAGAWQRCSHVRPLWRQAGRQVAAQHRGGVSELPRCWQLRKQLRIGATKNDKVRQLARPVQADVTSERMPGRLTYMATHPEMYILLVRCPCYHAAKGPTIAFRALIAPVFH